MTKEQFLLTKDNFSEVTEQIHDKLSKTKANKKEVLRADLLLEETFMRMTKIGNAQSVTVSIHSRLGDLSLRLASDGEEYNPLVEVTDYDENDEDYYRTLILKANRPKMGYARKNNKNVVTIKFHDASNKQIYYTLIGMALGVICGLIMKETLSPELISSFDTNIIKSFRTMFLNALNMMIAPVIFFSVISGITSITNAADVGRIGGKLIGFYTLTTLVASALSLFIGYFMFLGEVPQLGTIETVVTEGQSQSISLLAMLVGLVPKNLVDPIVKGEMLQIIFVAVVFGICINKLGDKVKILHDIIDAMNNFCLRMIMMIVAFIPFIAFLAMTSLIFNIGLDSVLILGKLVLGQILGGFVMVGFYLLMILLIGRITPMPFIKKIPSFIPIPMSTSSSSATMPFTMKFCTEKMGISPKLSSFSIPVGATINMDGGCLYLSIASIMLARMYGVELNYDILFTIFVTVVALSIGAPGVPGGAFVCLASIVTALGLPAEATAVILGIDPICSMLRTVLNIVGDIAATTALARNEKLMNIEIYLTK